jgi:hypothetical protein
MNEYLLFTLTLIYVALESIHCTSMWHKNKREKSNWELIDGWEKYHTYCIEMSNKLKGLYPNDKFLSDSYLFKAFGIRDCINDLKKQLKENKTT